MTRVVGLLGGIGSGKSEVARLLAAGGGRVINADRLGHLALEQTEIRQKVVEELGQEVLGENGEIVRSKVAALVFGDAGQRRKLEEVVHPWIKDAIEREVAQARAEGVPLVVLDAAVMLEAGWTDGVDCLVYVDTPRVERLRRIAATRGWTEEEVSVREMAQLPLEEKARRADAVVSNEGSREELGRQVAKLLRRWGLPTPEKTPETEHNA